MYTLATEGMTKSLKACLPALARTLGEKSDTLYERQRALVREGLLESLPGHGRGAGVRATSESVAMLLIGYFASTNLSGAGPAARALATAPPSGAKCPLTGAKTFLGALMRILSDEQLAKRVSEMRVTSTHGAAVICFDSAIDKMEHAKEIKALLERNKAIKMRFVFKPLESVFGEKSSSGGLYRIGDGIQIHMTMTIEGSAVRELTAAVIDLLKDNEGEAS